MPKKELVTVAVVEEEIFLRTSLGELIGLMGGYRVVATTSYESFATAEVKVAPRITLVGVGAGAGALLLAEGLLTRVKARWPGTCLLVMTGTCGRELLTRTMGAGVRGYILRGSHSVLDLRQALEDLIVRGHSLPAEVVVEIANLNGPSGDDVLEASLTRTEKKVLDGVCTPDDPTWEAVAKRLFKSAKTIGTHTANLFDKLGVHDKEALKAWGRARGFGAGKW